MMKIIIGASGIASFFRGDVRGMAVLGQNSWKYDKRVDARRACLRRIFKKKEKKYIYDKSIIKMYS
jgi:hypothetical protein